jgi:hypothetical protein
VAAGGFASFVGRFIVGASSGPSTDPAPDAASSSPLAPPGKSFEKMLIADLQDRQFLPLMLESQQAARSSYPACDDTRHWVKHCLER